MSTTDDVRAVMRGPSRTSDLPQPRLPRHLLKKLQEEERKTGVRLTDHGGTSTESQEQDVTERHQRQVSACLLTQQTRSSQEAACPQVAEPESTMKDSLDKITLLPTPQPILKDSHHRVIPSSTPYPEALTSRKPSLDLRMRRQQWMRELLEEKPSRREQGQVEGVETAQPQLSRGNKFRSLPLLQERMHSQEQSASKKEASSSPLTSLTLPPFSDAQASITLPRRSSLRDSNSVALTHLGSSNSVSLTRDTETVRPTADSSVESSNHMSLKSLHPNMNHALSKYLPAENSRTELPKISVITASSDGDCRNFGASSFRHDNNGAWRRERMLKSENSKSLSSTIRGRQDLDSITPVRDLPMIENLTETAQSGGGESSECSPPVCKQYLSSPVSVRRQSAESNSKLVNFCKVQIGDGDQAFTFLLVGPVMEKLLEVFSSLNMHRGARMLRSCMTVEDLLDELREQMEVQLVVQNLHRLPPGGKYSVQKLVSLSDTPLAHKKPDNWDEVVKRFNKEGITDIILKSRDVKCFKPSDYRRPELRILRDALDYVNPLARF